MTKKTHTILAELLTEELNATIATIEYSEFLLNQDAKFRIEPIEDTESYQLELNKLKGYRYKLTRAAEELNTIPFNNE
jgi:hypothetical protein